MSVVAVSCVGTVEEGALKATDFGEPENEGFPYTGIVRANTVAQDKIEIEFEETYNTATYSYYLHVNEDSPIKLSLESLGSGQIGYKKYTLKNLLANSYYKLRVSVEAPNGAKSAGENQVLQKTFDNKVANFDGVVGINPIIGKSHNSARVSWIATEMKGSYEANPFDTVYYEVTYILASEGLSEINTPGASGRQVVKVVAGPGNNPDYLDIKTLEPDTSYFFQVRAVHKLYKDQEDANQNVGAAITLNKDSNTTWLKYKTTPANGVYSFDENSVVLKNASGLSGLSTINVFWKPPEGIFEGYKVFYREYTPADGTDVTIDDELTKEQMQSYLDLADTTHFKSVDVSDTSLSISGLNKYSKYQIKVVPCKTVDCKIFPDSDVDSSTVSALNSIRVEAALAPFFGINFINEPNDSLNIDKITLEFDPPVLSSGYANKMKVYCLNYEQTDYVELTNTPAVTTVGNCNGLKYNGSINIATTSSLVVEPVNNIDTSSIESASYCFAMAPQIEGPDYETVSLDRSKWIVRCIQPDIKTPNLQQFAGLDNACNVNKDTATLNWTKPTGGIYNKFRLFRYKKVSESDKFSFFDMISNVGVNNGIYNDITLDSNILTYQFTNLVPGTHYSVGILAIADNNTPGDTSDDIYSEYNLQTLDCKIPYPTASFEEWTRIFAVGGKVDGRVPTASAGTVLNTNAMIYEAINSEGIPYEVEVNGDYINGFTPVNPGNYALSPGNLGGSIPSDFTSSFDGRKENGFAASNSGIVSLAWKNISLNFASTSFNSSQDHSIRGTRKFGYRVYRSDDNRQNWIDITTDSGLVHSGDYSYYLRSNSALTTDKMAFFTDYSVVNIHMTSASTERARVYWYKIVPVFDDHELSYSDNDSSAPQNIIKVTLPPPNMALVHRLMANRNICTEMDLTISKDNFYQCDYNGMGSRPKTLPWKQGETAYDFGGDLLVDRNELGCNYTRGSSTGTPEFGNSYFNRGNNNPNGSLIGERDLFTGYSTDAADLDNLPFRGCTTSVGSAQPLRTLISMTNEFNGDAWDDARLGANYESSQFDKLMYGDCIHATGLTLNMSKCSNPLLSGNTVRYSYPGLPSAEAYTTSGGWMGGDCSLINNSKPNFFRGDNGSEIGLLDEDFIDNITIQAEHMAVSFNREVSQTSIVSPFGPAGTKVMPEIGINSYIQPCTLNIAAIGAKPVTGNAKWKSRWVPVNLLNIVKKDDTQPSYVGKTVTQTHNDSNLYQSDENFDYRVPTASTWNSNRFDENTKIGRIFSTNSSKLPPLVGFSRQESQRLCETYEVEVGFSANGSQFNSLKLPKKKRLLRKTEFIASSAFSEILPEVDNSNINSRSITNIEKGQFNGACNNNGSYYSRSNYNYAGNGSNRDYSANNGILSTAGNSTITFLNTGSSFQDSNGGENSELCVSRYGIQDLIGNLAEHGPEQISCDYSLDAIYFGVENVVSQSVLIDGFKDPQNKTGYTRLYPRDGSNWLDKNAVIRLTGPDGIANTADDIVISSGLKIWVDASPTSGYCSMVDTSDQRLFDSTNFVKSSGIFESLFSFNGSLNTGLVNTANPTDQESLNWIRNGDGYFFNTGPVGLMPKLANFDDTLSLNSRGVASYDPDNQVLSKYFNPATGFTLACDSTNIDTCGVYASDNRSITTSFLKDNTIGTYTIDDFPVGNSQILHSSLGTFTSNTASLDATQASNDDGRHVIKEVVVDSVDNTDLNIKSNTLVSEVPSATGNPVDLMKKEFKIARFSYLKLLNGGAFNSDISGRYGMTLGQEIDSSEHWQSTGSSISNGVRCAVKIND